MYRCEVAAVRKHTVDVVRQGDALQGALIAVTRRLRAQRAIELGAMLGIAGLGLAAVALGLRKLGLGGGAASPLLMCAVALPLLGALIGALRPVARLTAARLLDAAQATPDLLASAWSFATLAPERRTQFMQLCLTRAQEVARTVRAAQAMPLRPPSTWRELSLLAVCTATVALLEAPSVVAVAPPPPAPAPAPILDAEDLAAFREPVEALKRVAGSDSTLAQHAHDANEVLEGMADGRIDRVQALRKLGAIGDALAEEEDGELVREGLREVAERMGKEPALEALRDAFQAGEAERGAKAMRELVAKLDEKAQAKAQRKRLKRSLERAASEDSAQRERLQRKLDRLRRDLDKQQQANDAASKRRLKKRRQQHAQAQRELERANQRSRKLDKLRRDLGDAAEAMGGAPSSGGQRGMGDARSREALERAAEELDRLSRDQESAAKGEELRQQLTQLRELLQQARQRSGSRDGQKGKGKKPLDAQRFGKLARGQGASGDDGGEDEDERKLLIGPAGEGQRAGALLGGQTEHRTGDATGGEPAPGAGEGGEVAHGSRTTLEGKRVDTRVAGEKRAGPSRREVILGAADHGFASLGYRQVHSDYKKHVEEVLEREKIPPGYRFYVRRYFQLIRPRESSND
jgi:hypothetical protein